MENKNGGLLIRFIAYMIDVLLFSVLFFAPLYLLLTGLEDRMMADPVGPIINIVTFVILFVLLWGVLFVLYQVFFISKFGGTLGKLACGMKVHDYDSGEKLDKKTAFYRFTAGYAFSSGFFGLGFWRIIKHDQNLGWHDELFGTKVEKTSSFIPGIIALVFLLILQGALIALSLGAITAITSF